MSSLKRRDWVKAAVAAAGAAALGRLGLAAGEGEPKFSSDFGADWELQKAYTLEVAEVMPAEKYGFKPVEEMRSFGEVLAHIGGSIYFMSATARGVQPPAEGRLEGEPTKEKLVAFLTAAFDYAAQAIASLDNTRAHEVTSVFGGRFTMSRAKLCEFMRNHTTHHRAYLLPYVRLNAIKPPDYRFTGRGESPV